MLETRRRSGRKREDKSYVECPDIVIEEDYLSKPSPAKRPNLNNSLGRLGNHLNNSNGIEMESDEEEIDDDDENELQIPSPKVSSYSQFKTF